MYPTVMRNMETELLLARTTARADLLAERVDGLEKLLTERNLALIDAQQAGVKLKEQLTVAQLRAERAEATATALQAVLDRLPTANGTLTVLP